MTRSSLASLVAAAGLAFAAPGIATAKTCKATVKAKNISNTKEQATKSAIALWSTNAQRKYGASFASWSKAGNPKVTCTISTVQKRQKQLCIAAAKPCSD